MDVVEARQERPANIRSVALPSEHGGWGFLIEPILLGLLVAGSWQGMLLTIASVGVFLIHQPLKLAVKDRLKRRYVPRTALAERFVLGYGLLAVVPLLLLLPSISTGFWLPIAFAVPFAAIQLYFDARNRSRHLLPELSGAFALAMIAPAIAVLGGWEMSAALVLWSFLAARALTSILYVRARLKLERRAPVSPRPVWIVHALAVLLMIGLSAASFAPRLSILAFAVLTGRAWLGLSPYRKARPAKIIGVQELGYGLLTVGLIAFGYAFNL